MRFVTVLTMIVVSVVATGSVAEARGEPVGPPETLAAQRQVDGLEVIESEFPINFLGVLYEGEVEGGAVRFRNDGRWGSWVELIDDGVDVDGRWASGLVSGADADAYQVRVPGGARRARAVAINTTDGPTQAAVTASACPDTTAIVTRCEWGADESLMTWGAPAFHPAQKLTVHHTASANGVSDPAAVVRAIYRYQAVDRGFGDMGYNYVIDEAGRVYEGRHSGNDGGPGHNAAGRAVVGAHVGGFNSGNLGIAMLGTLTSVGPRPAARDSLEELLTTLSTRHGIDPRGSSLYVNPVTGATKSVANIAGHRDWAATECPGGSLYALLPSIREAVASSPPPPPPDVTPPVITSITVSTTANGATVSWTTDEPSTSTLRYRRAKTTIWTSVTTATPTTSHSITVGGLTSRTSYQYRVRSVDAAGNRATSARSRFKTQ